MDGEVSFHLHPLDWVVLGLVFAIPLAVGWALRRKGAKDSGSFLLSGRSLPWWLAGTSMAADTFGSDTPLDVVEDARDLVERLVEVVVQDHHRTMVD